MPAVASSTSGYWIEIGSPQFRQRPRSSSHETTGMLSYARMPLPQRGQRDRGRMTDCSAGSRTMQTLRKLPNSAPNSAAMMTNQSSGYGTSPVTGHLVKENGRRRGDVERLDPRREPDGHTPPRFGGERGRNSGALVAEHERH